MSQDETRRLLAVASSLKARTLLSLGYGCGLRAGEVVRLKIKHIDSAQKIIRIEQSKGRKDRNVMLVMVATPSHGARTSTSAQVLAEHRQINVARHCPLPGHDMAEVRCRPQVSHGRAGTIALPLKHGCETVKVSSAWPASQMPQHLRCREVCLQHVRPRL